MTNMADCRRVWECAIADGDKASLQAVALGVSVVALLAGLLGAFLAREVVAGFVSGAGFPLCGLALYVWSRFLPGAARQIGALPSGVVPRLNRSVRTTVMLSWGATMLPFLAMAYVVQDRLMFVAACVVAVTAFGLYHAGRGGVLICALAFYLVLNNGKSDLFMAASPYRAVIMSALLAGSLAFAGYALSSAFPRFGRPKNQAEGGGIMVSLHMRFGGQALGRHMLLHALGRVKTWRAFLLPPVVCLLVVVAAKYGMAKFGLPFELSGRMLAVPSGGLAAAIAIGWWNQSTIMWGTSVEQSLVRLAPGAPARAQFNRTLARQILQANLSGWVLFGAFCAALIALWDIKHTAYLVLVGNMAWTVCGVGAALGDYSSRVAFSSLLLEVWAAIALVIFLISLAFLDDPVAWGSLTLVNFVGAFLVVRARWKVMLAAPVAFPAGRAA